MHVVLEVHIRIINLVSCPDPALSLKEKYLVTVAESAVLTSGLPILMKYLTALTIANWYGFGIFKTVS